MEVGDFQCPYCGRFAREVFPKINDAYVRTGKVRWMFINLPLSMHLNAWPAAEAALCAGAVSNRFWPMHDRLFATQDQWSGVDLPGPIFARYAQALGVPAKAYQECVADDRMAPLILKDAAYAGALQITGTPSFVVDQEEVVVGLKSFDQWKQILDKYIKAAEARKR
jgi:protein-disulfide isomerase